MVMNKITLNEGQLENSWLLFFALDNMTHRYYNENNFNENIFNNWMFNKMTTRNEQKENRRNQILMTALDLFVRKGFSAAKITDIAKTAGMSMGLMFHYFESKERLYEELIQMGLTGPQAVMAYDQSNPMAFFESAAKLVLDHAKRDPYVAKMFVLMSQAANNDFLPKETREHLKRDNYLQSAEIIRAGQKNGTIREGDPVALAVAFWAAIQGICQAVAVDSGIPCPDGEWVADMLRKK